MVSPTRPLYLSDGTPVRLSKITSKGNIQVVIPTGHPLARGQGSGRIFAATTGRHYKGEYAVRLTNDAPRAAAPVSRSGGVDVSRPLALSDGTPATFVKITSKGNIQVRLPGYTVLGASDPLRIFKPSGEHYKLRSAPRLVNADATVATTATAVRAMAPAPAVAPRPGTYTLSGIGGTYRSVTEAEAAAYGYLRPTRTSVQIKDNTSGRVVRTIGVTAR
jgi:hypothetical protein